MSYAMCHIDGAWGKGDSTEMVSVDGGGGGEGVSLPYDDIAYCDIWCSGTRDATIYHNLVLFRTLFNFIRCRPYEN